MDGDNLFVILIWLWILRWAIGAGYGIYLMRKSKPGTWTWQDQYIAGAPFWVCYLTFIFARWIARKIGIGKNG